MGPTGNHFKVLQVHPTRLCNLQCLHCYSSSGPQEREELPADLLLGAIEDAAGEGYNDVGFSGGEPILYKHLRTLLSRSKELGLVTSVTSNGMLLDERRIGELEGVVDLLAISLDGTRETHNLMRNSPMAFDKMSKNLERVRGSGIPFGFIFTLTLTNLNELKWVSDFALEQGAALLQIHPLEEVGRASTELQGLSPDDREAAFGYLEAIRLQSMVGDKLAVRIDLVDRELLRPEPDRVFAGECSIPAEERPLGDLVNPLVIEQDGAVVPLQYGFGRHFALGNLYEAPLKELAERWRQSTLPDFGKLCRSVYESETTEDELPIFNWYESIGNASRAWRPLAEALA